MAVRQNHRVSFLLQACMDAEAAYAENPFDAENLTRWGGALLKLSHFHTGNESIKLVEDAVSKLEEALRLNPRKHDTLWWLGNAHVSHGFLMPGLEQLKIWFDKATECFQEALELDPGNQLYLNCLNVVLKVSKKTKKESSDKKRRDLVYDILGWLILAVGIVAWVVMAKSQSPTPPPPR